jgi:hypothetical protein
MSSWIPAAVAGAIGATMGARARHGRVSAALVAAGGVALGTWLIKFEYDDAQRAALGEASLDGAPLEGLGRRQARCSRPEWRCQGANVDGEEFLVPSACGASVELVAAFTHRTECEAMPVTVHGYLVDRNELGGGAPEWRLQVDAPPRTFPGPMTWMGAALAVLSLSFPRVNAWAAARQARTR